MTAVQHVQHVQPTHMSQVMGQSTVHAQTGWPQPAQPGIVVQQPLQSMNSRAGELSTCSSTNLPSGYADGSPLLGVNSVTVPVTTTMVSPRMPLLPDHSAGLRN